MDRSAPRALANRAPANRQLTCRTLSVFVGTLCTTCPPGARCRDASPHGAAVCGPFVQARRDCERRYGTGEAGDVLHSLRDQHTNCPRHNHRRLRKSDPARQDYAAAAMG